MDKSHAFAMFDQVEGSPSVVCEEILTLPLGAQPQVPNEPLHADSQVICPFCLLQLDQRLFHQLPLAVSHHSYGDWLPYGLDVRRRVPRPAVPAVVVVPVQRDDDPLKCTGRENGQSVHMLCHWPEGKPQHMWLWPMIPLSHGLWRPPIFAVQF